MVGPSFDNRGRGDVRINLTVHGPLDTISSQFDGFIRAI